MRIRKKQLGKEDKQRILSELTRFLRRESAAVFAYAHGSFLRSGGFHDLDVAVFVDEDKIEGKNLLDYELELSAKADLAIPGITIDLRLLNTAPLGFRFRVVNAGLLLFSKDEAKRVTFVARTRDGFFDFEPHRRLLYKTIVLGEDCGSRKRSVDTPLF
jgi:predicted nucleotidyltransferase